MSFTVRTERSRRVVSAAFDHARRLGTPRAGVLLVAGALVEQLSDIAGGLAEALREHWGADEPLWLLAGGAGVLTERGEIEHESAACGLVLNGVAPSGIVASPRLDPFVGELAELLHGHPSATALTLVRSDRFDEDWLGSLPVPRRRELGQRVFGGGSSPNQDLFLVSPGQVRRGAAAALLLAGLPARIRSSPACRLLGPLRPITKTRGSMVLEIDDERALDVLSSSTENIQDQPLVLLAVASTEPPPRLGSSSPPRSPAVLVRAIQGVDPSRGGILIGGELPSGTRVAFAVRDAALGRASLETELRQLVLSGAGVAPRFGIYVNCAGRGSTLYGSPDVDTKLLRAHLGELPLVGIQTAFELAPFDESVALQMYTGVLGLFSAPS